MNNSTIWICSRRPTHCYVYSRKSSSQSPPIALDLDPQSRPVPIIALTITRFFQLARALRAQKHLPAHTFSIGPPSSPDSRPLPSNFVIHIARSVRFRRSCYRVDAGQFRSTLAVLRPGHCLLCSTPSCRSIYQIFRQRQFNASKVKRRRHRSYAPRIRQPSR